MARRTRSYSGEVRHSMLKAKENNISLPIESEDKRNNIVKWGKNNEHPYFLNYLAKSNSIHAGILNAKVYFSTAGGINYEGENQKAYDLFFKNKKKQPNESDIEDVANQLSRDFEKSNLFCARVFFTKIGEKRFRKIERIPFEKIRFEIEKDESGEYRQTGNIAVSDDWLDKKPKKKILHPYDRTDVNQRECFVLHMVDSGQSFDDPSKNEINPGIYPDPPYAGAITAIETGIQIGNYNNAEIHNGFSLGTMLYLANGEIKDEEKKRRFEKDLEESATGSKQAGRLMAIYGKGKDNKPEAINLNGNDLPDRYLNAKKSGEESTVHGHSITTPLLAGIKTEGSLGNSNELEMGYAIFKQNYISGRQEAIIRVLQWIMNEIAGIPGQLSFNIQPLQLDQAVSADDASAAAKALNQMSPLVATKVLESMTPNEIRNLAKLRPQEGGDKIKEPSPSNFSADDHDIIMSRFKKFGRPRHEVNAVHSISMIDGSEAAEQELISTFKKEFQTSDETMAQVLGLINDGEKFDGIRKALDLSGPKLAGIYQAAQRQGLIDDGGELTTEGRRQVAAQEVANIEIMYEYRLRPNAPALLPDGESRDFCKELIRLNRVYTREDIQMISGREGYDVFAYAGGWYHNPNTGKNEPKCRHEWAQIITFN